MLALVVYYVNPDLAGYIVTVFEAFSLEGVAAPVVLVVYHHQALDVRMGG